MHGGVTGKARKGLPMSTNNTDIFYFGHTEFLKKARSLGDVLIHGLVSDKSGGRLKGLERPIIKGSERAYILSSLECVDFLPGKTIEYIR